jgi:glyoxylase-like metal-dependent hydrolase (beta-lactamase superfamily II)
VPPTAANDATKDDSFAKHSFPPDGLVALSRVAYQQTPLSTSEVRRGVFVFTGAGGNITAIEGSLGCTVVDSGFGPRLAEIEAGLAAAVPQAPRWLINTHWHFDHTDGNAAFAAADATMLAHANCRFRLEILNSDSALYGGSSNIGNEGAVRTLHEGTVPEVSLVVPPLAAIFLVPER